MAPAANVRPGETWDSVAAVETLRRGARLSEAMAACDDLLQRAPDDPRVLLLAATIRRDRGQFSEALAYLDRVLAISPSEARVCRDVARLRRQCGNKAGAKAAYRMALTCDPAYAPAHCELAELHVADGQADDAIYHLEIAIAVEPGRLDAREQLALLLEANGRGEEATALRRETMYRARRMVDETYTKIRTPAASTSARSLQRLRLSWAHALLVYGTAGIGVAKYEEAEGDTDRAVAAYLETLGTLSDGADQAKVVPGLRRVFATATIAFSQCHYELALLHDRRDEPFRAIHHIEEALRARGSPWEDAYAQLGVLIAAQDTPIAAIRESIRRATDRQVPTAAYPVTRWDFAARATQWLAEAVRHRDASAGSGGHRIAMVAGSPFDFQMKVAIACVLIARGHSVDLLWLPGLQFAGECDPEPAYDRWDEKLMADEVESLKAGDLSDGLTLIDLRTRPSLDADDEMERVADGLAERDCGRRRSTNTVYATTGTLDAQQRERTARNLYAMRRLAHYFAETPPHHLLAMNGDTMESGCAFWAARQANCPAIVWEPSPDRSSAISIACNETRDRRDFSELWRSDEPHELSPERRERVLSWFSSRTGGDFRIVTPRKRYAPPARSIAALADHRLDSVRPVVVLFGDRNADLEVAHEGDAFPDSRTWIMRNIEFFGEHPEWQLIVRLYPQDGPSGVRTALREKRADLPRNVSLVESSDAKLDYRLLEVAQLGLFRTNPIGLEIAMMGVVAVASGHTRFSAKGFTRDAGSDDEYFKMIRRALENPDSIAMTDREIELAWCFADLSVYAAPKVFPWTPRNFWRDVMEEWPVSRVLGGEGMTRFGKVFSILAGEVDLSDGVVGDIG
jgi:tetratricopeptide (TPR) repeat protein